MPSPRPGETGAGEYFGEGFFDSYEDEESVWDETFTAMLEEEARLQTRYYELSAQAADYQDDTQGYYDACADGMASLLAELTPSGRRSRNIAAIRIIPSLPRTSTSTGTTLPRRKRSFGRHPPGAGAAVPELDADAWEATGEYASGKETLNYLATAAEGMGGTAGGSP